MGGRDYIDLLELQTRIKESIADAFPGRYWVKAEIASWSPRANGHCYLTLTQTRGGKPIAESRAMIWKWKYPQLTQFFEASTGQRLQAGITVLVQVQVSFSELYGVSLFIEDVDPAFTLGEKALERKRAIEKLTAQGYMEMQKELALPDLPYRLAVITSQTAAGYQDFRNHLLNNPEGYARTSLLAKAKNLKGKLQIITGYNDNTVVPQHCLSFLDACIKADTQPDFFAYPGEEHNMRGHASVHLHERITQYFEDYLKVKR